jgi:hypothetical protein
VPQEKILDSMLDFKPLAPLFCDFIMVLDHSTWFGFILHPWGDSSVDIHLSQETRVARIFGLTGFFQQVILKLH